MKDRIYIPQKMDRLGPCDGAGEVFSGAVGEVEAACEAAVSRTCDVVAEAQEVEGGAAEIAVNDGEESALLGGVEAVDEGAIDETAAESGMARACWSRRGLFARLAVLLLSAVALTVYGVWGADLVSQFKTPPGELLAGEVLGTGVTVLKGNYTFPPLTLIPPQTVGEGEKPGAAEEETAPPAAPPLPGGNEYAVRSVDLSAEEGEPFAVINETPYEPDPYALLLGELRLPTLDELRELYGEDAPVVLILHTHGTEAYSPEGADSYPADATFRSHNADESVVAVGRVVKEELAARGIGVIHLENMFDLEDYNSAYYKAASEIRRYTEAYPSISYVFDIHRDAMISADGVSLRPLSDSGEAQIMFVVGTDHAGSGHTAWQENFTLALRLQESLIGTRPTLMRALNLRSASFNQQYTSGSLLIEVGAAGNSLSEAKAAARLFAVAAAEEISRH